MRVLVCNERDPCARWLVAGLSARGTSVELVSSDQLVRAPRCVHRVGAAGVDLEIDLADGRHLRAAELTVVLNRLDHIPIHLLATASEDVGYATQELHALWLSWLEGLPCRVVNRPSATSLSGPWLSDSEWILQAGRCGLPTKPLTLHPGPTEPVAGRRTTMLVASGSVFGPPGTDSLVKGALALARAVGVDLLELRLARDSDGHHAVDGASVLPDLRPGGSALLDHLNAVLA